jgi:hypothetical protein
MLRDNNRPFSRIIPAAVLVLSLAVQFVPMAASATPQFGQAIVRLDRMKANTATGGTVCAKISTASTEAKVVITFPSTYTLNTTTANWVVNNTNLPVLPGPVTPTFWLGMTSGTTTASAVDNTAKTVTFPSGDLTQNTTYCFNFVGTNTLTTAASAAASQQASVETQDSGSVALEHTDIALANITDDQIIVSAVVPPTFVFTLSGNTDNFGGNLDPTAGAGGIKSSGGRTVSVTTNAKGGWIAWAKDSNQGLRSATANYTIAASGTVDGATSTINGGVEGYVLDVDLTTDATGGCTLAIDGEYDGNTTAKGGTLSGNFQPIATCTGAPPATANGDVVTLVERATIAGSTPAGNDYTDTITVVGAGNF